MTYPTREEFDRLEAGQKRIEAKQDRFEEELHKLREQQTEPIRITRLEIDQSSMQRQLKSVIQTQADHSEKLDTLDRHMQDAQADIQVVKANQGDLRGYVEKRFNCIEETQEAHKEVLGQLVNLGESHTKRFDQIEATMATKEDLKSMATKEDLKSMATKEDLKSMATKESLKSMATREDLKSMATREDLAALETRMEARIDTMESHLVGLIRQFLDKG
jgi:hypothetical protein